MAKCCAPNCFNNQRKDSAVYSFFEFPENPDLRARWISNIGRPNWMPGRRSLLCSAHFENSQLQRVSQHICLRDGAVPSIFQLSGRRKASSEGIHVQTKVVSDVSESSSCGGREVRDPSPIKVFIDQVASVQQSKVSDGADLSTCGREEIYIELNNQSNALANKCEPEFKMQIESENFMNEFVLIDGNYILEDGQLIEDTLPTQSSHVAEQSFDVVGQCGPTADNIITVQSTSSSPSLENSQSCEEEGSIKPGNVIIVKPDAPGEMVLLQETFPLLSDNVICIQQSPAGLETVRSQSLNISEIATPCSGITDTAGSVFSVSEMPSESDIETQTFVPLNKQKLSYSDTVVSIVEEDDKDQNFKISSKILMKQLPSHLSSIEKIVIDLPASLENHILCEKANKQGYLPCKWQKGTFMCRLCGVASNKTINLFGVEASEMKLLERISSVLHFMILQCDELPQSVCSECLSRLDICSELIVTSVNTHIQLASVMGQDVKESLSIPVYFNEIKKNADIHSSHKRHILLMEIFQEEDKPVEESLAVAFEDLRLRLQPENADSMEPKCSFVLIPLTDGHSISHVEQVRTAAEALITRGLKRGDCQEDADLLSKENRGPPYQENSAETSNQILQCDNDADFEHDFNETSSETLDEEKPIGDTPLLELTKALEVDPTEVHTMPITDDVSPYDFYSSEIKFPKMKGKWQGRGITVNNMQKLFYWNESGGNVNITCRLCKAVLDGQSSIQIHLKEHLDVSCRVCLAVLPSQQDRGVHKCGQKSALKVLRPQQSLNQKLWNTISKRRFRPWYQCSFCSMHFKSKLILEQHLQQLHAANSKCNGCGFDSSDVCEAALHRQMCAEVKKQKEWQCRKCLEIFSVEDELLKHQASSGHDNKVTSWLCDVCGKKFPQAAKLSQHKKTHLPSEFKFIHQCPHCPKRYINASRLKEHMQKHEEKKYMCKVCGKLFGTKQILRQHEFTHGDPQFLCSICSRTFFRKSHLLKHMNVHSPGNSRANRSGPQPHRDGLNRCRECKKVFDQRDLLNHYKTFHPHVQLQNYVCEICKEENTSYAELFQHQREAHKTGVKDCPFCDKTIDSSTQMKYHLMRHEGMFPYNCPLCSNGYTANSILQDHIRRKHTGEKPFECKQCFKRFPTSGALAQHNTVHSLPHQLLPCPFCNQGFKRKAHLDVHIRTHTGEKPYPCPICDRPFRQRPDCVKHVRVIHGEDPSKFNIRFHPNTCVEFPQVVSVADMELVLEGEDLMQASLEANQLLVSQ